MTESTIQDESPAFDALSRADHIDQMTLID
jgi:hypothetical protein